MVFTRLTVSRSTAPAFAHSGPPASGRTWLAGPVDAGVPVDVAFPAALPPPQAAKLMAAAAAAPHSQPRRPALRARHSRMPIAHLVPGPEPDRSRWRGPPPMGRITWTALPQLRFPVTQTFLRTPAGSGVSVASFVMNGTPDGYRTSGGPSRNSSAMFTMTRRCYLY